MKRTTGLLQSVLLLSLLLCSWSLGQSRGDYVRILMAPQHSDWLYRIGEKALFQVSVYQFGRLLEGASIRYECGPEMLKPVKTGALVLKSGQTTIDGGTLQQPGFLNCKVVCTHNQVEYIGMAAAAFEPEKIQPTTTLPPDFKEFWDKAKAAAAEIPMDARMTLVPSRCTETVDVYHISVQNYSRGARVYGMLCVPKKPGKYPALLRVPGAGIRPYQGDVNTAAKGVITLEIGIHGIPVNLDPSVYDELRAGPLNNYQFFNLDDRDRYYYKRVYLGCVRAVDFIFSLPQFDGERLAVTGGSQGGALSIITAGLDPRIKWLVAYYPALCDVTGYLHGRAGGWPHMFNDANKAFNGKADKIETSKYYDVVNFARFVQAPGYYAWGFNDNVCPPTSMYAAYNVITAPKTLLIAPDTGHWAYAEEYSVTDPWLLEKLTGTAAVK
ncbi:MAG TPA: acetylxylan esterase [bacterium]|nr:acetylxylan esterase [bacterium]